ncbi:MAG: hypothetical protein HQ567_17590 [Candidatus Nealsonbacteria bacterium]|nr:hypothetical protein [Candidatus Nealsonbacteria bacterium]
MSFTERSVEGCEGTTADVTYKIASSREERAAAFRLVYDSYLKGGLGEANSHRMRVTPYHLLPSTEVFIAVLEGEVIFTASLILDGVLGLPMESVYGPEVASRRVHNRHMAEVSCMADRRGQFQGFFPVFLKTCRLLVQYARTHYLDELLAAVHPRHANFYRRYMDFQKFGGVRSYPAVKNLPAVALELDFARIDRERPENYDTFFGEPLPAQQLLAQPITAAECNFFRPMVEASYTLAPIELDDFPEAHDGAEGVYVA